MYASDITSEDLAAMLDDAWEAVQAANQNNQNNPNPPASQSQSPLRDQLRAFEKQVAGQDRFGSMGSMGGSGSSQSFRGPGPASLTSIQRTRGWRILIRMYDTTKAWVDSEFAEGESTATDSDLPADDTDLSIYQVMAQKLSVPITEYESDITDLLLPPTLSPPTPFSI